MKKKEDNRQQQGRNLPGACSLMTLTSKGGKCYWFRTCDISFDLRKEGAHRVEVVKGQELEWEEGQKSKSNFSFQGVSYQQKNTWLLDGVNEEGLCGGLLMLKEGRGSQKEEKKENRVMAMEAVAWFLSRCSSVKEVIVQAEKIEITDIFYENQYLPATVHYHFCDCWGAEVILEPVIKEAPGKLKVILGKDTLGIMTNSPVYEKQKENLSWFLSHSWELNSKKEKKNTEIFLDGKRVEAKEEGDHLSLTGCFPGSFASYDRFIRLAVLKSLNHSGNLWEDEEIIWRGIGIMNTVREPENQGKFHYSYLEERKQGEIVAIGRENSKTEYLVIYDLWEKKCYLQWFDEMQWTCYTLGKH